MRYPDTIKQTAKELYLQAPTTPVEQLSEPLESLTGVWVAPDTLRDWRTRYAWDTAMQNQVAGAVPVLTRGVGAFRMSAAIDAMRYLADVVNGVQEADKERTRIALHLTDKVDALIRYTSDLDGLEVRVQPVNVDDLDRRTNDQLQAIEDTPGWTDPSRS